MHAQQPNSKIISMSNITVSQWHSLRCPMFKQTICISDLALLVVAIVLWGCVDVWHSEGWNS